MNVVKESCMKGFQNFLHKLQTLILISFRIKYLMFLMHVHLIFTVYENKHSQMSEIMIRQAEIA